jgi:hypothetical protein
MYAGLFLEIVGPPDDEEITSDIAHLETTDHLTVLSARHVFSKNDVATSAEVTIVVTCSQTPSLFLVMPMFKALSGWMHAAEIIK